MGLFNTTPSILSTSSSSNTSTTMSKSSAPASPSKLKRNELSFPVPTHVAPNSRLLAVPLASLAAPSPPVIAVAVSSPPISSSPVTASSKGTDSNVDNSNKLPPPTSFLNPSLHRRPSTTSIVSRAESAEYEDAQSHLGSASESESEASESDASEDELSSNHNTNSQHGDDDPVDGDEQGRRRSAPRSPVSTPRNAKGKKRSYPATLVFESMSKPPSKEKKRKNVPLASLTFRDVALTEDDLRSDIQEIWTAMHCFMSSRMVEAEDICLLAADHRLYYSVGYSLIQVVKSLATFEPEDLEAAIQCCRDSIVITSLLRKKDHGVFDMVKGLATGSTSVASIRSMSLVQRHAELIYAECTLLKAVVGIIYSGDFMSFIKEALNMRNAYSIFRTLHSFVERCDIENNNVADPTIDEDFRSGVFFGNGLISMILSILPNKLLKVMEMFGFTGDSAFALETLMKGGRWTAGVKEPAMDPAKEGIRRQLCDLALLTYHLVLVSYLPVAGVDVPTADAILNYNLDRYPHGIFFLYFSGRLHATQTTIEPAVKAYHLAIQAQREYIQLQHICHWDLGLVSLASGNYPKAYECYNILSKESNWSKAIYSYAKGVSLFEAGEEDGKASEILTKVPELMQRIVGKSIPLEKFVARRARKYIEQDQRLVCPGIELAYVLNCLGMSPRFVLFGTHLDQISDVLSDLHDIADPREWSPKGMPNVYWDDYCLAHFLRGVVLRLIAHPAPHAKSKPLKSPIPVREADEQALISFNNVLKHGAKIHTDHHIVWFSHYELGRLYSEMGEPEKAAEQFELILSGGKAIKTNPIKGKGSISLRSMVILRSNAALVTIRGTGRI